MRDTARVGRRVDSFCAAVDRGPIAAAAVAAAGSRRTPPPSVARDAKAGVSPRLSGARCGGGGGGARARGLEERHERIARVLRQEGLGEVQKAGHCARHLPAADPSSSPRMSFSATSRWRDS